MNISLFLKSTLKTCSCDLALKSNDMSLHYKQIAKLLERWPLDKSKAGRDLGERLRNLLKKLHNPGRALVAADETLCRQLDSLDRLSKNIYSSKYKRTYTSTATGLTAQQCSQVLSSEFLEYLNDYRKSE